MNPPTCETCQGNHFVCKTSGAAPCDGFNEPGGKAHDLVPCPDCHAAEQKCDDSKPLFSASTPPELRVLHYCECPMNAMGSNKDCPVHGHPAPATGTMEERFDKEFPPPEICLQDCHPQDKLDILAFIAQEIAKAVVEERARLVKIRDELALALRRHATPCYIVENNIESGSETHKRACECNFEMILLAFDAALNGGEGK